MHKAKKNKVQRFKINIWEEYQEYQIRLQLKSKKD